MSLLPWSLSCIFIFWFWRCSSGTSLAACELSALPPSLLRHPKPWPRIKAFTTAFSLQDWYGALPSVPAETQSRFSFSLALLSPVYLALSRRTGRSFGYKQFPVPWPWPWCYFHESAALSVRQQQNGSRPIRPPVHRTWVVRRVASVLPRDSRLASRV